MYRAGSLRAVGEEISKYKLDLLGVHEVRWNEMAMNEQANIHFSMENGKQIMN
jgi:ACT domain-containing protein